MKLLRHLLLVLCLAGCAASGPLYQPPPAPSAEYAQIVIYRVTTIASAARAHHFWIDGKAAAELNVKGYTHFLVKPGAHEVHAGGSAEYRGAVVPVVAAPGKTYYFQYGTAVSSLSMVGGTPIAGTTGLFVQVPESLAKARLPEYHFQAPVAAKFE